MLSHNISSQQEEGKEDAPKRAKLTPDIEAQLKEAFAVFDVSGDGQIDATELQTILRAVNNQDVPIEDVVEMIAAVDDGGDGEIQLPEFLQLMADQMSAQEQDEELIAAFKVFGASGPDDVIGYEGLAQALEEMEANKEFEEGELKIIYDEVAGASRKPMLLNEGQARPVGYDEPAD